MVIKAIKVLKSLKIVKGIKDSPRTHDNLFWIENETNSLVVAVRRMISTNLPAFDKHATGLTKLNNWIKKKSLNIGTLLLIRKDFFISEALNIKKNKFCSYQKSLTSLNRKNYEIYCDDVHLLSIPGRSPWVSLQIQTIGKDKLQFRLSQNKIVKCVDEIKYRPAKPNDSDKSVLFPTQLILFEEIKEN